MYTLVGVGIDIVDTARMRAAKNLKRMMDFFLTEKEKKAALRAADTVQFAASRFAAKEAVIKAFPGRISPLDFEIVKTEKKPTVRFLRKSMHAFRALVSIAHLPGYAAGAAVVVRRKP